MSGIRTVLFSSSADLASAMPSQMFATIWCHSTHLLFTVAGIYCISGNFNEFQWVVRIWITPTRTRLASANEIFRVKEWSKSWVNLGSRVCCFCHFLLRKGVSHFQSFYNKNINKGQCKYNCRLSCRKDDTRAARKHGCGAFIWRDCKRKNVKCNCWLLHVELSVIDIPSTVSHDSQSQTCIDALTFWVFFFFFQWFPCLWSWNQDAVWTCGKSKRRMLGSLCLFFWILDAQLFIIDWRREARPATLC